MNASAPKEFAHPDVGVGLTEAEILTWRVSVGDLVAINDILVDIETAKSIVELPSPYAGVVSAILVGEGQTVPVGTPIIAIGGAEVAAPSDDELGAADESVPEPERQPTLVGYGVRVGGSRRRNKVPVDLGTVVPLHVGDDPRDRRVLAKPPVRKLAKDLGIDLRDVRPSGPVITRADVEAHAATHGTPSPASPSPVDPSPAESVSTQSVPATQQYPGPDLGQRFVSAAPSDVRLPVKGVRKVMAETMVRSAFTAPHVTEWVTVDVTRTTELVARLKQRPELRDVRVGPLLVLARACLLAVRRTPIINSFWDEEAQEVVFKEYVNLGIAAATPRGLVVPNVKDAGALALPDLAAALDRLVAVACDGKTPPPDLAGGTFTITNVGSFGVDSGTPIINPGESAILCFGAIKRKPWVVGDAVVPRDVCTLSLSFDHRHVDGAAGSQFLADVASILEDPATALLF
jgi:pyruvate dehydrogenase E2 component (dihydrolipoamide acetyltransferase)